MLLSLAVGCYAVGPSSHIRRLRSAADPLSAGISSMMTCGIRHYSKNFREPTGADSSPQYSHPPQYSHLPKYSHPPQLTKRDEQSFPRSDVRADQKVRSDIDIQDEAINNARKQEILCRIRDGANPLYPINRDEIERIMGVYTSLPRRPVEGITKVFLGNTNSPKSSIYSEVLDHIRGRGSDLETYREIYAKLSKSLNGSAISVMRNMMLRNSKNDVRLYQDKEKPVLNRSHGNFVPPSGLMENRETLRPESSLSKRMERSCNTVLNPMETKEVSSVRRYELGLLSEIYRLLPHVDPSYITRLLIGKTKATSSPTYKAVSNVISKIQHREREAGRGGEKNIDIEYFQQVYKNSLISSEGDEEFKKMLSNKVESLYDAAGNLVMKKGMYRITEYEQKLLHEIYSLLPHVNASYITRLLAGKTKAVSSPTYKAVTDAISKIRQREREAGRGGEEEMDIDYFVKLHWSSIRITGRCGYKPEKLQLSHVGKFAGHEERNTERASSDLVANDASEKKEIFDSVNSADNTQEIESAIPTKKKRIVEQVRRPNSVNPAKNTQERKRAIQTKKKEIIKQVRRLDSVNPAKNTQERKRAIQIKKKRIVEQVRRPDSVDSANNTQERESAIRKKKMSSSGLFDT